jgi:leucyl-tRNA---protein transferase
VGIKALSLYTTPPHACSYLEQRQATSLFVDPFATKDNVLYEHVLQQGFRRSGEYLYRPQCESCQACIAVRIPVASFKPKRIHKRILAKNQDLTAIVQPAVFKLEHFQLYYRYLSTRHVGGGMENSSPTDYLDFLTSSWAKTFFYEFRLAQQLMAVAVVDKGDTSLSAVYTFFDPEYTSRSLGSYAILFEIDLAKRLGLDYVYLGYWIAESRKMAYKINYQPLEYYFNGQWSRDLPNVI